MKIDNKEQDINIDISENKIIIEIINKIDKDREDEYIQSQQCNNTTTPYKN